MLHWKQTFQWLYILFSYSKEFPWFKFRFSIKLRAESSYFCFLVDMQNWEQCWCPYCHIEFNVFLPGVFLIRWKPKHYVKLLLNIPFLVMYSFTHIHYKCFLIKFTWNISVLIRISFLLKPTSFLTQYLEQAFYEHCQFFSYPLFFVSLQGLSVQFDLIYILKSTVCDWNIRGWN